MLVVYLDSVVPVEEAPVRVGPPPIIGRGIAIIWAR